MVCRMSLLPSIACTQEAPRIDSALSERSTVYNHAWTWGGLLGCLPPRPKSYRFRYTDTGINCKTYNV